MGWTERDAEEMSMALDAFTEYLERLVEMLQGSRAFEELAKLAEEMAVEPEPRMTTTMHITTHSAGKVSSLAAAIMPKRRTMRQHTAATGM